MKRSLLTVGATLAALVAFIGITAPASNATLQAGGSGSMRVSVIIPKKILPSATPSSVATDEAAAKPTEPATPVRISVPEPTAEPDPVPTPSASETATPTMTPTEVP